MGEEINDGLRLNFDPRIWVQFTGSLRRFALPKEISTWSLTSMKQRVIKVCARLVMHARRLVFQMSEMSLTRGLFPRILERIRQLEPAPV